MDGDGDGAAAPAAPAPPCPEQLEAERLELQCEDQLRTIDDLAREVRRLAVELDGLTKREEDAQREADRQQNASERQNALQERFIGTLEKELERLLRELEVKAKDCRVLEEHRAQQLAAEDSAMQSATTGVAADGSSALPGDDLARVLRSRELRLRELEDRELSAEDVRRANLQEQQRLAEEHRQLTAEASEYMARVERQMVESQSLSDKLNGDVQRLSAEKRDKQAWNDRVATEQETLRLRLREFEREKQALEQELLQVMRERDEGAGDLKSRIYPATVQGSQEQLMKLEEVMMLLKANAVQVGDDHQFLGEVFRAYADAPPQEPHFASAPMEAYCTAFDYIQEYVWAAHGQQRLGERWVLLATHEPRYDEVEQLLSALKQMVAAFDMMDTATKRQIPCAADVLRNSSHLVRLAHENSVKFAEMVESREDQRREEERARSQRVRRSLELSRRRNRQHTSWAQSAERDSVRRNSSGALGAPQQRQTTSPRLQPLEPRRDLGAPQDGTDEAAG
eukprot:TRINITY_DN22903_c0_g1_i1.p1 TRINITY_DN22903_c0_g1~~TRINITY_DN22903_c0_g1_i1.p1  ORF type:complete len:542 (+),score=188.07 TRINITY_DN22903_c0_g1_i1:91-1626(+)